MPSAALAGLQRPRLQSVPLSNGSAGQEAVELAASAGLFLDPWQAYALEASLGERYNGRWAARDVCLICSRQNGKGSILEARELAGLFLFGERELIHTAHLFKTAADHFLRVKSLIANTPDLMRQVKPRGIRESHGEEGITLRTGARLRFVARSVNGSGRGFAKIDLLVLDEAYDIPRSGAKSLLPTQLAASNPQTWYTSSVEDRGENTEILLRKIEQGRGEHSANLCYLEWSGAPAEDGSDPDTPENRAQANPGLGLRLDFETLQSLRESLGAADFAVEHLSIWPKRGAHAVSLFGEGMWEACAVPAGASRIASGRCFGIAVTMDRSHGCIGAAGLTEADADGYTFLHVEPVDHRPGVDWIVDRARQLQAKWSALFVIDGLGPAAALIPALTAAGVKLVVADTGKVCDAFAGIFDAVQAGAVNHLNNPELNIAIDGANVRTVGERKALGRKVSSADISPLEAVTLAAWGTDTGQVLDYDVALSVF